MRSGNAANLEHCISELKIAGHYCSGNVAEFWSLTNEERMRAHEINVETAKGRIPLIAGCHHQNPYEVVQLARHAQAVGIDFVIILTPYIAVRSDDAVYEFYRFVADRVDIGIVLFNIPQAYYPIASIWRSGSRRSRTSAVSSRPGRRRRRRSLCARRSATNWSSALPTRRRGSTT